MASIGSSLESKKGLDICKRRISCVIRQMSCLQYREEANDFTWFLVLIFSGILLVRNLKTSLHLDDHVYRPMPGFWFFQIYTILLYIHVYIGLYERGSSESIRDSREHVGLLRKAKVKGVCPEMRMSH